MVDDLRGRTTLFCGVLLLAIAGSVLLRGRRLVHLLFAAFALCAAAWYASQSLADLLKTPVWGRANTVLTVLLPQFAIHVFDALPKEVVKKGSSRLARFAALAAVPFMALALTPYHAAKVSVWLIYTYVFALIGAALVRLSMRGKVSVSKSVRDRVRFLVAVGVLAATFTAADFLSFLGIRLPPIGALLATLFFFVLGESIQRSRLADLYELVGKLLVSTTLAFALAGIFYGLLTYVGRFGEMYFNAVIVAIVFLVLFEPLRTEIERRIHQFFFRERHDLETSMAELRRKLSHSIEAHEIRSVLLAGLEASRRVTHAALYVRDPEGFELLGAVGGDAPPRLEALALRPLIDRLDKSLVLEQLLGEPDAPLVTAAATFGPVFREAAALAIRSDEQDLVGLLLVADERIQDAYTPEEISLFEDLSAHVGIAISNTRLYGKLKERDRLAALGAMAAGLAHEVKNPLGAIKGAAQLLQDLTVENADEVRDFLSIIVDETNRLNRVVGSFLDYARPNAGNPVPLDVNTVVKRTVQILSGAFSTEKLEFKLELCENLPYVSIDAEQLRQVLINLVQNAAQAMNENGQVLITSQLRAQSRSTGATVVADIVELSVHDTGPGISPKVLQNLFVPFVTTKQSGTGLGLAISQRIIQNAGGRVEVQSHSGAGSTFTIVLPATKEKMLDQKSLPMSAAE
jgi:two-component system, NtrC family, sensor histidine kinase HydH